MAGKIGALIVMLIVAGLFIFGKMRMGAGRMAASRGGRRTRGWSTELASDSARLPARRQATWCQAPPSGGMSDYQFQFPSGTYHES